MTSQVHPPTQESSLDLRAGLGHRPVLVLFLLCYGLEALGRIGGVFRTLPLAWLTSAVWSLSALTLLVGLTRRLPLQNVLTLAVGAGGIGGLVSWWISPAMLFDLVRPVVWITLAIGSRGTAQWLLKPWRGRGGYGWGVMALSVSISLGVLAAEFLGNPAAGEAHWPSARVGGGAIQVGAWTLTLVTIHVVTTPWVIDKRPAVPPADAHSALVMLLLLIWQMGLAMG